MFERFFDSVFCDSYWMGVAGIVNHQKGRTHDVLFGRNGVTSNFEAEQQAVARLGYLPLALHAVLFPSEPFAAWMLAAFSTA